MIYLTAGAYFLYFFNVITSLLLAFKNKGQMKTSTQAQQALSLVLIFFVILFSGFLSRIGVFQVIFLILYTLGIISAIFVEPTPTEVKPHLAIVGLLLQFIVFYFSGFFNKLPLVISLF